MRVQLLGTGSADGWPNPWCRCASCTALLERGEVRAQSAAVVDDRLLLDCGPDVPRSALRQGVSLVGLRHQLLTHSHPDHCGPAALMWRSWAALGSALDVVGPQAALDACRDWVRDDSIAFRPVTAGDRLQVGEYDVRVLPAAHGGGHVGEAVLYDVSRDGHRLLWATDTAALPPAALEAATGAAYDLVLMEETFGTRDGAPTSHLDLRTFPEQLAELRRRGAITATTRVVAIHLGHHNPPPPELDRVLGQWGASAPPDGTVLDLADPLRSAARTRRVLVTGGARSGKSHEAERRLLAAPEVCYVATSQRGDDAEWEQRVRLHEQRRPASWTTVETVDLRPLLQEPGPPLLVDCLTLWLTRLLDEHRVWDAPSRLGDVRAVVDATVEALRTTSRDVVLVTNEVGSGVVPDTASGRLFRDELGRLNALVSQVCDEVVLVVAGRATSLTG